MPPTGEDYLDYEKKSRYRSGVNSKKDKNGKPKNGKPENGDKKKKKNGTNGGKNKTKLNKTTLGKAASTIADRFEQETHY